MTYSYNLLTHTQLREHKHAAHTAPMKQLHTLKCLAMELGVSSSSTVSHANL